MKSVTNTVGLLFIFACFSSCGPKEGKVENQSSNPFVTGKRLAELKSKKLKEVSGLAASINNKGMLWTHNDSGNDAEVYLIDMETNIRQTYVLAGVDNRDWEDISIGPGPDSSKHYLYVGDIGDNLAVHPNKYIYRFEEPVYSASESGGESKVTISDFDTIVFSLAGSKHDTEALLVDPKTKDLYVLSKYSHPIYVYQIKYPYATANVNSAVEVASLNLNTITSADFSPEGDEVLIKNYSNVYYWKNNDQMNLADLLKQQPVEVTYEEEPQGEAIAWAADGSGFYTLSEKDKGKKTFLYFYQRR
jgi:hypothetical protein